MEQQQPPSDDYYLNRLHELQQEHGKQAAGRLLLQETLAQTRAHIEATPFQFED